MARTLSRRRPHPAGFGPTAALAAAVAFAGVGVSGPAAGAAARPEGALPAAPAPLVRAQKDSVGYAVSPADMAALLAAVRGREQAAVEARRADLGLAPGDAWVAAVMPHDDYLYAGPTCLHLLPGLKADRWLLFGVCHACRRLGVRDRLIFDESEAWSAGGVEMAVDRDLRARLLAALGPEAAGADAARHADEHSLEGLVPWLGAAAPDARIVPILVPGMEWPRLRELSSRLAAALAEVCRERGWVPGRDVGILVSADAVHYGCEGWGPGGGHAPFGCDEAGHAAAVARDATLAEATLAGPLTADGLADFVRLVWNPAHPDYPREPYRITWCGLYSIPFGLLAAADLQAALGLPPLLGHLLRYGDSVTDGRLEVAGTRLGVTAPNTLRHWVGYPALGYVPASQRP